MHVRREDWRLAEITDGRRRKQHRQHSARLVSPPDDVEDTVHKKKFTRHSSPSDVTRHGPQFTRQVSPDDTVRTLRASRVARRRVTRHGRTRFARHASPDDVTPYVQRVAPATHLKTERDRLTMNAVVATGSRWQHRRRR